MSTWTGVLKVKKKGFVRQSISRLPYPGKPHAFVLSEGFSSNSLRLHACSRTGSNAPPVGTTWNHTLSALQGTKGYVITIELRVVGYIEMFARHMKLYGKLS